MPAVRLAWITLVCIAGPWLVAPAAWAQCTGAPLTPGAAAAQIVALAGQGQTLSLIHI